MTSHTDALDSALVRIAKHDDEFGGQLTNHAPMVAEVLNRRGFEAYIGPWLDEYLQQVPLLHNPVPVAVPLVDATNWRAEFSNKVRALAPDLAGGATHGFLRSAHAARALANSESPERFAELQRGLAYWNSRPLQLPRSSPAVGTLTIAAALRSLPTLQLQPQKLITTSIQKVVGLERFAEALNAIDPIELHPVKLVEGVADFLSDSSDWDIIVYTHAFTTAANVLVLTESDLIDDNEQELSTRLWEVVAAFAATYPPQGRPFERTTPLPADQQFERAVGQRDEHAIKLADALWTLEDHGVSERVVQVGQRLVAQLRW